MLRAVAVERNVPSEPAPTCEDLVQRLSPGPLLERVVAQLEQGRATRSVLLAHGAHRYSSASTTAPSHLRHGLEDLYLATVFAFDQMAGRIAEIRQGASRSSATSMRR